MAGAAISLTDGIIRTVGSFGGAAEIRLADSIMLRSACDLAEIRMDLIAPAITAAGPVPWEHLADVPLLFTARRPEEGGAGGLDTAQRLAMLESVLDHAALIDIEVASIGEMRRLLEKLASRGIPWIASYHDFEQMPTPAKLDAAARHAKDAGASAFKAAARLHQPADLARLAEFQLADHGLPVATMGMGPMAPVSRLLCAQCGSVLNYGYLGETPTAPGQWDAAFLKQAIMRLAMLDGDRKR